MKHFGKLLNFEITRFMMLFSIMMGAIVGIQITTAYFDAKQFVKNAHNSMKNGGFSYEQYAEQFAKYDITYSLSTMSFFGPLMFGITVLVLYVFFIWYRDWFGKATFSYRLFMLPTRRIDVYFAKLAALLLFIFTALVVEVAVIYTINSIIPSIIPAELYQPLQMHQIFRYDILNLILPTTLGGFAFNYILGITAVTVVFTMILLERSYRLKGVVFAILYAIASLVIVLLPVIYQSITSQLFMNEVMVAMAVIAVLVGVAAVFTANHLLKYKINV